MEILKKEVALQDCLVQLQAKLFIFFWEYRNICWHNVASYVTNFVILPSQED